MYKVEMYLKVMEMHTKLMDQLDICKEQELVIIKLTQQLNSDQSHQDFDSQTEREQEVRRFQVVMFTAYLL